MTFFSSPATVFRRTVTPGFREDRSALRVFLFFPARSKRTRSVANRRKEVARDTGTEKKALRVRGHNPESIHSSPPSQNLAGAPFLAARSA